MVGFVYDPTIDVEEGEFNHSSELKKSNYPPDLSLPELDDFSLSFADSFLDLDSIKDWIEENPDPYSMTDIKPEPDRVDHVKIEFDPARVDPVKFAFDPDRVEPVKVEFGVVEKRNAMAEDGSCKETTAEDPVDDGSGKLGSLGGLIEEELGKVSLEGVPDSVVADANGTMSGEAEGVNGNGMKSGEIMGVVGDGVKSSEVFSVDGSCEKSGAISILDRNGAERGEIAINGKESDSDSESESASSSSTSSSSSSSSSDEDDDDDDDSDDDDDEESGEKEEEKKEEEEKAGEMDLEEGEIRGFDAADEMVAWSDGEDDGGGSIMKGPIRSENELKILPPVPPVDVMLQPYHHTLPVGVVLSIMGAQVIVEGVEKHNPLNEGSILWITESRSPLGLVDEIFGPVKNPYYVVRYNSDREVPDGIQQGSLISFVPEFAYHVLNDSNLYKKGYDASGENDEELSDEVEFSDDEKEAEYKRMLKMTKRGTNDQKVGNRKKDKKKFKNLGGNWKNDQSSATQAPVGASQLPLDQTQFSIRPVAASLDHGNCSSSCGPRQSFAGGAGFVSRFPQLAQAPGFVAPSIGVWTNGIPCQQPQTLSFPNGFPTNGMPWPQQSHPQQPYQMPLPNGAPYQQQFDTSQRLPTNFVLPGGQSNFCAGPAFAPMGASMGQIGFNQLPFGMGLQGQHAYPSMNVGEQRFPSNGLQMEHNCDVRPPSLNPGNNGASQNFNQGVNISHDISGNTGASQNFNQGVNFSRGRKQYLRGGGRFRGGRGRQQFK